MIKVECNKGELMFVMLDLMTVYMSLFMSMNYNMIYMLLVVEVLNLYMLNVDVECGDCMYWIFGCWIITCKWWWYWWWLHVLNFVVELLHANVSDIVGKCMYEKWRWNDYDVLLTSYLCEHMHCCRVICSCINDWWWFRIFISSGDDLNTLYSMVIWYFVGILRWRPCWWLVPHAYKSSV